MIKSSSFSFSPLGWAGLGGWDWGIHIRVGSANFFCKGLWEKYFGFCETHTASAMQSSLCSSCFLNQPLEALKNDFVCGLYKNKPPDSIRGHIVCTIFFGVDKGSPCAKFHGSEKGKKEQLSTSEECLPFAF